MEAFILSQFPKSIPFVAYTGIVLSQANDEGGAAHLDQRVEIENHIGSLHAGALFTLAETAAGAALTAALFDQITCLKIVATAATITYQKKALGRVTGIATLQTPAGVIRSELTRNGLAQFQAVVSLTDEAKHCVAECTFKFQAKVRE